MGKNKVRGYIILAVLLVVFSVIAFVPPFEMTTTFWIGYVFGVLAIAFQIYIFKASFEDGVDVKSKFYGFPIAKVGVIYLACQLLVSLVEIGVATMLPVWIAVIFNVILTALAVVGCIAAETMRDEIVRQDEILKENVSNMRALQSLSSSLVGLCQDENLKKTLQDLADEFKYSDPVSSEDTLDIENNLKSVVGEIQKAIIDGEFEAAGNLVVRAKSELAERNRVCKLGK